VCRGGGGVGGGGGGGAQGVADRLSAEERERARRIVSPEL
jgi:hypothetical protein